MNANFSPFGFTCVDVKALLASASTVAGPGMELGLERLSFERMRARRAGKLRGLASISQREPVKVFEQGRSLGK